MKGQSTKAGANCWKQLWLELHLKELEQAAVFTLQFPQGVFGIVKIEDAACLTVLCSGKPKHHESGSQLPIRVQLPHP